MGEAERVGEGVSSGQLPEEESGAVPYNLCGGSPGLSPHELQYTPFNYVPPSRVATGRFPDGLKRSLVLPFDELLLFALTSPSLATSP